jgi:hypothetical protein
VIARAAIALAVVCLAAACHTSPAATRTDLRAYLARAKSWAPVEAEAARTIDRILRTQFVDEAEVRRQIADSRPRVLAHLQQVRSYKPQSKDVAEIHERYVKAWERLLAGYDAIEEGFSTGDYTKLARGREAMEAWRAEIVTVADDLRELMQHFGVEPTTPVESRAEEGVFPQLSMQRTKSSARPSAIA